MRRKRKGYQTNPPTLISPFSPTPHLLLGRGSFNLSHMTPEFRWRSSGHPALSCPGLSGEHAILRTLLRFLLPLRGNTPRAYIDPHFCSFPRVFCIRGGSCPLTRTTTEDALVPRLLRRRKWSRPCLSWQARPQHRHTPSSASHFHSVKVSA
jgi:hypothetical protein